MSAGKIEKLQELLPVMKARGDRVLIFSQFTQVLDILEVVLDTMELKYLKLTGQTAVSDRQNLVDAFNKTDDITVFCASLLLLLLLLLLARSRLGTFMLTLARPMQCCRRAQAASAST